MKLQELYFYCLLKPFPWNLNMDGKLYILIWIKLNAKNWSSKKRLNKECWKIIFTVKNVNPQRVNPQRVNVVSCKVNGEAGGRLSFASFDLALSVCVAPLAATETVGAEGSQGERAIFSISPTRRRKIKKNHNQPHTRNIALDFFCSWHRLITSKLILIKPKDTQLENNSTESLRKIWAKALATKSLREVNSKLRLCWKCWRRRASRPGRAVVPRPIHATTRALASTSAIRTSVG